MDTTTAAATAANAATATAAKAADPVLSGITKAYETIANSSMNILAALILLILGFIVIGIIDKHVVKKFLDNKKMDPTLSGYLKTTCSILLKILLIISCLGVLGVETTSFAAIIGACGLAIGMAWAGLLSNFAAGAFLLFLRPFKVGDYVSIDGTAGEVMEIGVFCTVLNTPDKVKISLGNNAVLSGKIENYSHNEIRRVDLKFQVPAGTDIDELEKKLKAETSKIKGVLEDPGVEMFLLEFRPLGPVLILRPFCNNADYWTVYNDVNRMLSKNLPRLSDKGAVLSEMLDK